MTTRKKAIPNLGATRHAPKNRPEGISSARKAAFNILLAVERGQSHSDDLLRGKAVNALLEPDRNLATALVLGVLRWQIRLDQQLHGLLSRPNARLDPEILIALRMGAFQILRMDRIPARAAIDESVELAKQAGHRFASGMVNAVLRKLAKPSQSATDRPDLKGHNFSRAESSSPEVGGGFNPRMKPTESTVASVTEGCLSPVLPQSPTSPAASSVVLQLQQNENVASHAGGKASQMSGHDFSRAAGEAKSRRALAPEESVPEDLEAHPAWMVERWISQYGLAAAQAICRHGQSQPVLTLRLASPAVEAEMAASGVILEPGEMLAAARTVVSGDADATDALHVGRVRFQDEGSQLVAELAGMKPKVDSVLDACAAPGGKTLILAELNPQARIVACESSAPRLEHLRKRLAFLGDRVECRLADATTLTEAAAVDLVLADVPCSGTGTLGRNPEIRHRLRSEDLARQSDRQRAILSAALRAVRPGGRVVYSTCSLEPEENEQVIAAVLAATPNARLASLEARIGELMSEGVLTASGVERLRGSLTPEGFLRLLPGAFHTDGFFIALLERTS